MTTTKMTTKQMNKVILILLALIQFHVYSKDIYVSKTGNDSNAGTEISPYLTISKAASIAVAGDIVYIKAGTYEETLSPANSGSAGNPIIFKSFPGDKVIITAMQALSGWTQSSGSIYKTTIPFTSLGQENLVMHQETALDLARWPNKVDADPFLLSSIRNTGGSGSDVITGAYLTEATIPNIDWTDGAVWFYGDKPGSGWIAWKAHITSSASGQVNFNLDKDPDWIRTFHAPADLGDFYLEGVKAALDYQNEWYFDSVTNELFLQLPSGTSPVDGEVQMRKREETINLKDKKYIEIRNLAVFGGSINMEDSTTWQTNTNTTNNVLYGISSFYGSYTQGVVTSFNAGVPALTLQGSNNTIEKCEFAFGTATGINVRGENQTIINNYIHDYNTLGSYDAPAVLRGMNNSIFKNNTVKKGGRDAVNYSGENNVISYNDVSQSNLIADDCALFYTVGKQLNTEIHHNWFHDAQSSGTKSKAAGVYLDNDAESFTVHHNVIWNTEWTGIQINWNGKDINIYNNTLWNNEGGTMGAWHKEGTEFTNVNVWNNLGGDTEWEPQSDKQNNITTTSASFVNSTDGDFNLVSDSEAIDAGRIITGITDGYLGSAPDVGANEYSATEWVAGINWNTKYGPAGLGCYGLPGEDCEDVVDTINWNPQLMTLNADTTLEIPIKYTSTSEIAAGGILFTFWVVQPSPWWHQWKAQYSNNVTLPSGIDVETTITITPPASVTTDGIIWTTDALQMQDINNSGATYRYELRMFDGSDPNFTPTMPSHSYLTISEPLSAEKETLNKIKIYPNPTKGTIHISNIENIKLIHIKSILGKHILTIPATNIIDISHFPSGMYILQMDNGILRKLIKY